MRAFRDWADAERVRWARRDVDVPPTHSSPHGAAIELSSESTVAGVFVWWLGTCEVITSRAGSDDQVHGFSYSTSEELVAALAACGRILDAHFGFPTT